MPTTTTNYSLYKPLVGDPVDEDLWGGYLNDNMDIIDAALAPFSDSLAVVKGSSDATKKVRLEVDGLTTATTRVLTVPDADITLVGTSNQQTLSTKFLEDSSVRFVDNADTSKRMAFECSGITASTTRVVTVPDKDGTMAMLSDVPFTLSYESAATNYSNGSAVSFSHGLGVVPKIVKVHAVCQTTDANYATNDIVELSPYILQIGVNSPYGMGILKTSSSVVVRIASSGIGIINKTTYNNDVMIAARWKLVVQAWA